MNTSCIPCCTHPISKNGSIYSRKQKFEKDSQDYKNIRNSQKIMPLQIIYLNSPFSSGKTSLAHALQEHFNVPYLHVGIDKLIGMMPYKMNNRTGKSVSDGFSWKEERDENGDLIYHLQSRPFAEKIRKVHKDFVHMLAKTRHFVIVDDVSYGNDKVREWKDALQGFDVLLIGITRDLFELQSRELQRKDRMVGSSTGQFPVVHKDVLYGPVVDTTHDSIQKCTHKILEFIQTKQEPS